MNFFENNEYTKGFAQLFSFQADFLKQITEANKKLAIEVLKAQRTVLETTVRNVDETIRKFDLGV